MWVLVALGRLYLDTTVVFTIELYNSTAVQRGCATTGEDDTRQKVRDKNKPRENGGALRSNQENTIMFQNVFTVVFFNAGMDAANSDFRYLCVQHETPLFRSYRRTGNLLS